MKPDINPAIIQSVLQRAFPHEQIPVFERAADGTSTQVYRIVLSASTVYLRFGEDPQDTFAPEAFVHNHLRNLGVCVPEVLFLDERCAEIERSVMITSEMAGSPACFLDDRRSITEVVATAGNQLALLRTIPVEGFGFLDRARPWNGHLTAPFRTISDLLDHDVRQGFSLIEKEFTAEEGKVLAMILNSYPQSVREDSAVLAHGDIDCSHIYQREGHFTGLIDFGEIRGEDRWHDLAMFLLTRNGDTGDPFFASMLDGYQRVWPIAQTELLQIRQRAVLIGLHRLIRIVGRSFVSYQSQLTHAIRTSISAQLNRI